MMSFDKRVVKYHQEYFEHLMEYVVSVDNEDRTHPKLHFHQ